MAWCERVPQNSPFASRDHSDAAQRRRSDCTNTDYFTSARKDRTGGSAEVTSRAAYPANCASNSTTLLHLASQIQIFIEHHFGGCCNSTPLFRVVPYAPLGSKVVYGTERKRCPSCVPAGP